MLPEARIYASVTDASGCYSELVIRILLSDIPELDAIGMDELCIGNNDGIIEITTPLNLFDYTLILGADTILNNTIPDLSDGDYTLQLIDSVGCETFQTVTINPGFDLMIEELNLVCNNNGTGTNSLDDYYDIDLIVTGGQGQFNLMSEPVVDHGMFNYDESVSITLPANGMGNSLMVMDITNGCTIDTILSPLTQCSTDCDVTINGLDYTCNDNGTPLDSSDDVYDFVISVEAINGDPSNTYQVLVNNIPCYTFNYDEDSFFSLPADGTEVSIIVEDISQTGCSETFVTDALEPCSNLCQLTINLEGVNCVDPGTPADNDDDLFEVILSVSGINASAEYSVTGFPGTYLYDEMITLDGYVIANGAIQIEVIDSEDGGCSDNIMVAPPAPCSMPCEIQLASLNILDCNDNMTGNDSSDDFYLIEVTVDSVLGTGQNYWLVDESNTRFGPYQYDMIVQVGPFSASGNIETLFVEDEINASCFLSFEISQEACSECNHDLTLDADYLTLNCQNTQSQITAMSSSQIVDYQWFGPNGFTSNSDFIEVGMPGQYELTVSFEDACTLTETIDIESATQKPVSDAGEDKELNCEIDRVVLNGAQSQFGNDVVFTWLDEMGDIISEELSIEVTEPGIYTLVLVDTISQCVSQIDTVEVLEYLNQPQAIIYAEPDTIINCLITSVNLRHEEEPNTVYRWDYGNQIFTDGEITIMEPQVVILHAMDTLSLCEAQASIEIADLEVYPSITFEEIEVLDCVDNMACVEASSTALNDVIYNWYNQTGELLASTQGTYCADQIGTYTLEVEDIVNGCRNSQTFTIENPLIPNINLPASVTLINDEAGQITASLDIDSSELSSIQWQTAATLSCYNCLSTTIVQASDSTLITLNIVTQEGCEISAQSIILVKRIPKIYTPNIFNPASGDRFTIYSSSDVSTIDELIIYDRWGNVVFSNSNFDTNDPDQGWNGTADGNALIQGVYVFMFKYMNDGKQIVSYGTITLIQSY